MYVNPTTGQIMKSDNPALTVEVDPQVSSSTTNAVPKWNGTTLVDGIMSDNGTAVTVTGNVLPEANDTRDLGSTNNRWANLWLGGETIHIGAAGDEATIGYNTTTDLLGITGNTRVNGQLIVSDKISALSNVEIVSQLYVHGAIITDATFQFDLGPQVDGIVTSIAAPFEDTKLVTEKAVNDAIGAEAAARAAGDVSTLAAANAYTDAEAATRAAADANEAATRAAADLTLTTNLNNEIAARQAADATLTNNLNNEITARQNADATLQLNINAEATARLNADAAEAATRAAADAAEAAARAAADLTLTTNLSNEIATRAAADATLTTNLNNEIAIRAAADAAEAAARQAADLSLQTAILNEAATRAAADALLQPLDADLTGLAALNNPGTANQLVATAASPNAYQRIPAPTTPGQVLTYSGASLDWVKNNMDNVATTGAATYPATYTNGNILVSLASNSVNINLPSAVGVAGFKLMIKVVAVSGGNTVTLTPVSGQTIDGATTLTWRVLHQGYMLVSDGTNWYKVGLIN
jgi:hypothetical protein